MLILVKETDNTTRILATVTEIDAVTSGSTLNIFNPETNVSTVFNLPEDSSPYPIRYNEFLMPTSTFSGLTAGVYDFEIKDADGNITEAGLLKVVKAVLTPAQKVDEQYTYIRPTETKNDFIVYQPR